MKKKELRAHGRLTLSQRATLNSGESGWFPCTLADVSDNGFLIVCDRNLPVGQVLQLRCELIPQKTLDCKIEIKHATHSGMGAKIVEIDNRGTALLQMYLQELYSIKLR